MDATVIGYVLKSLAFIVLWGLCARMLYKNEMLQPPEQRCAEPSVIAVIASLWIFVIPGIWLVALLFSLAWIFCLPLKLYRKLKR